MGRGAKMAQKGAKMAPNEDQKAREVRRSRKKISWRAGVRRARGGQLFCLGARPRQNGRIIDAGFGEKGLFNPLREVFN